MREEPRPAGPDSSATPPPGSPAVSPAGGGPARNAAVTTARSGPVDGDAGLPSSTVGVAQERDSRFTEHVLPQVAVMYRVALSLTGQPADAEDLVQESLIRAYRAVDRFDGAYPRAWLLTILRHTHLNQVRVRRPTLLRDGGGLESTDRLLWSAGSSTPSAEDVVVDDLFEQAVVEALAGLPEKHRAVVRLVDVDGLSYQEAADVLGVPRGTVMSRLHRARARIRGRLAGGPIPPRRTP